MTEPLNDPGSPRPSVDPDSQLGERRYGSGPPSQPLASSQAHPGSRARTVLIAAAVALIVVLAALLGLIAGQRGSQAPTSNAVTSQPTPTAVVTTRAVLLMDEQAACIALVPVLSDAADLVQLAVSTQDPKALEAQKTKLETVIRDLEYYSDRVPENMQGDVFVVLSGVRQVDNMRTDRSYNIQPSRISAAGLAIGTRCQRYAR